MDPVTAAQALMDDLAGLYERTRVREDQIAISRMYATASALKDAVAA